LNSKLAGVTSCPAISGENSKIPFRSYFFQFKKNNILKKSIDRLPVPLGFIKFSPGKSQVGLT
jgi:hypothetical protein